MEKPRPDLPLPGPHYFRLADASWIMIRSEYLNGATAKQVQKKWGVPPSTLYRHAYLGGWSKKSRADAFHEQVVASHTPSAETYDAARPHLPHPRNVDWSDLDPVRPDPPHPGETWTSLKDPPPPSMRDGLWPRPGPWRQQLGDGVPPGYGPMPPHRVPPSQRSPSDEGAPPVTPAPLTPAPVTPVPVTPAEVADQAVAAAGRALSVGRYAEAERLGKLAETMRRQAGAGAASRSRLAEPDEDDADEDQTPVDERPLNCTLKTCALHAIHQQARVVGQRVMNLSRAPEQEDLAAWADMAEAMGGVRDPELAAVLAAYRAEGMAGLPRHLTTVFGPQGDVPPATFAEVFRGR